MPDFNIFLRNLYSRPKEQGGLVPHLSFRDSLQMLAIRRFSIGLGGFHQFFFINETVYVGDFFGCRNGNPLTRLDCLYKVCSLEE